MAVAERSPRRVVPAASCRTAPTLNSAVIELSFDPLLRLGPLLVRWESVALAATVLVAILVWSARLGAVPESRRGEDLLYVVLAIIPGALVGGRVVHGMTFADVYLADPAAIFELSRGTLSLLGALVGGGLAGAYVCRLLGHGVARWADAAAVPLLLVIGLGKVALVLGGSGQGAPFDGPWATAFPGEGPWVSADAATPAHPAQLYEGLWTLAGVVAIAWAARAASASASLVGGRLFVFALAWWLGGRILASLTWRDEAVLGPLGGEQAFALVALAVCAVALARKPSVEAM